MSPLGGLQWNWSQVGSTWPSDLRVGPPKNDLKLNVFQKWRLGGLQTRFWKPQGSILEGLGMIFSNVRIFLASFFALTGVLGASKLDFGGSQPLTTK